MCLRWFCFFVPAFLLLGYRSVSLPLEKQLETARKRREREREREREAHAYDASSREDDVHALSTSSFLYFSL